MYKCFHMYSYLLVLILLSPMVISALFETVMLVAERSKL